MCKNTCESCNQTTTSNCSCPTQSYRKCNKCQLKTSEAFAKSITSGILDGMELIKQTLLKPPIDLTLSDEENSQLNTPQASQQTAQVKVTNNNQQHTSKQQSPKPEPAKPTPTKVTATPPAQPKKPTTRQTTLDNSTPPTKQSKPVARKASAPPTKSKKKTIQPESEDEELDDDAIRDLTQPPKKRTKLEPKREKKPKKSKIQNVADADSYHGEELYILTIELRKGRKIIKNGKAWFASKNDPYMLAIIEDYRRTAMAIQEATLITGQLYQKDPATNKKTYHAAINEKKY